MLIYHSIATRPWRLIQFVDISLGQMIWSLLDIQFLVLFSSELFKNGEKLCLQKRLLSWHVLEFVKRENYCEEVEKLLELYLELLWSPHQVGEERIEEKNKNILITTRKEAMKNAFW